MTRPHWLRRDCRESSGCLLGGAVARRGRGRVVACNRPRRHRRRMPRPSPLRRRPTAWTSSSRPTDEAAAKSDGCIVCHQNVHDPHDKETLHLGCVDCHGGDADGQGRPDRPRPAALSRGLADVGQPGALLHAAQPRVAGVHPLRQSRRSARRPHQLRHRRLPRHEVLQNRKSMMTHGCMLWGAALYNNGAVPDKRLRFGESYSMNGVPQRLQTVPPPTEEEMPQEGRRAVPRSAAALRDHASRATSSASSSAAAAFRPEVGIPEPRRRSGPAVRTRLSDRGLGTENRTDPVFLGLQKTRLLDPTLNFLGTNDHPGDYRSSGCTACHVIYANDRSPVNSGPYAKYGNRGLSFSTDPTIPKDEPAIRSSTSSPRATRIPTSQCIVCHIHPGTNVMNSYLGFMWWDEETDGELMYPPQQKHPDRRGIRPVADVQPRRSGRRAAIWSDPEFLENVCRPEPAGAAHAVRRLPRPRLGLPRRLQEGPQRQLARPRRQRHPGRRQRRAAGRHALPGPAAATTASTQPGVPVHLMDIHLEKGMHCVDCHFVQDVHGNTKLQDEVRAAIEIQCIDCHGTVSQRATLRTTGPASLHVQPGGRPRPGGAAHAVRQAPLRARAATSSIQNSMVEDGPALGGRADGRHDRPGQRTHYNAKSALAKTVRFDADGKLVWGDLPDGGECQVRPRQQEHELHRLPFVVEPELLRLPPAAEGQQEAAEPAQRGRRDAQLRLLQLPDAARRRVHAGPRRRRDRQPHRAGAVVVRHPRRLVQRQPRVDLRPAADDLRRGPERHRLQHQRAAHGARHATAPSNAPTATSRRRTTTTPSWPSC